MSLDPQYVGSGGGLYPASSQSQVPMPVGFTKIDPVPGQGLTKAQIQALVSGAGNLEDALGRRVTELRGQDVYSYSHNQGGTLNSNRVLIAADIAKNKQGLIDNGMTGNEQHYVYPAGQVVTADGVSYGALADCGMITGRGTMNNLINTSQYGLDQRYQLFCLSLSAQTGLAALQTALTRVVESGGTQIFCGHRVTAGAPVDAGNEISRADWRAFVDDLASKRDAGLLDVVTRQQWYAGLAA